MTLPTHTMKAVVTTGDKKVAFKTALKPKPGQGEVLVKVFAAAQNPSEWMVIERHITSGVVVGHDFTGVIEEIGPEVPEGLRSVGERVAGFLHGGVSQEWGGTFAEYCLADAQVIITIPDSMRYEDAAGLGLAGFTACQALWQTQERPTPLEPSPIPLPILVWGGASSVGQYTIQLAKLSGFQVITTASPKNYDLVKSLGADAVFDYRDPDVSKKIRKFTGNRLTQAIDCISENGTTQLVADSLGKSGGYINTVLVDEVTRPDVEVEFSLVFTLLGKGFEQPMPYSAIPDHYELGKKFGRLMSELLAAGTLMPNPVKVVPNGLADVQEWIQYQKEGKVSGQKIVFQISDTR